MQLQFNIIRAFVVTVDPAWSDLSLSVTKRLHYTNLYGEEHAALGGTGQN